MTNVEKILKDSLSPDQTERNAAEKRIKSLTADKGFIESLPLIYMKSSDQVVSKIAATLYKNNVIQIEDKNKAIRTSINCMKEEIATKNEHFSHLTASSVYKIHKNILSKLMNSKNKALSSIINENLPQDAVSSILFLELMSIFCNKSSFSSEMLEKILSECFLHIEKILNVYRTANVIEYVMQIFANSIKKVDYTEEMFIFAGKLALNILSTSNVENMTEKELRLSASSFLYSAVYNSIKKSSSNKVYKSFFETAANFENLFSISVKTLMVYANKAKIGVWKTRGNNEDYEGTLSNLGEILTQIMKTGYYLNNLPSIVEEICFPFLTLNEELVRLFYDDFGEYSKRVFSIYIESLSEILANCVVESLETVDRIIAKKQKFRPALEIAGYHILEEKKLQEIKQSIFGILITPLTKYYEIFNQVQPENISKLNNSDSLSEIFKDRGNKASNPQIKKMVEVISFKYASLSIFNILHSVPTYCVKILFDSVIFDFSLPLDIMISHSLYMMQHLNISEEDKFNVENANYITKLCMNTMNFLNSESEGVKFSATISSIFYFMNYSEETAQEEYKSLQESINIVRQNIPKILFNVLSLPGFQESEILEELIFSFPSDIVKYTPDLIIVLLKKITEFVEKKEEDSVYQFFKNVSELAILLGKSKKDKEQMKPIIINTYKNSEPYLFNLVNVEDGVYISDVTEIVSNFIFSMQDSSLTLPFLDLIFSRFYNMISDVLDEISVLFDNTISFSTPIPSDFIGSGLEVKKYLVSYKVFSFNLVPEFTTLDDLPVEDINTCKDNLCYSASEYLKCLFGKSTTKDASTQRHILTYILKLKGLLEHENVQNYIFEEEFSSLTRVLEAMLLYFTSQESTNVVEKYLDNFLTYVINGLNVLDDKSTESIYACSLFMHIVIRKPSIIQSISHSDFKMFIKKMHINIEVSSRVHEKNIILLFFCRIFPLGVEYSKYFSNFGEEIISMFVEIFTFTISSYGFSVYERYSGSDGYDYDDLSEDLAFITCLDYINYSVLLKDTIMSCDKNSLFFNLSKLFNREDRENFKRFAKLN